MTLKAIVIGSGPAGLIAANSLLDAGYKASDFVVLEKRPEWQRRPQEISLMACSSARLRKWGVIQKMEARNQISPRHGHIMMHWDDWKTGKNLSIAYGEQPGEYPGDLANVTTDQVLDDGTHARNVNTTTIGDTERAMLDAATERGVNVMRGVIIDLVWHRDVEKYEVCYTAAMGERVSLGIPDLVINCEGANRKFVKQVLGPRHGVEILPKAPRAVYFVCVNVYFPSPEERLRIMPSGIYMKTYGQADFSFAPVAGAPSRNTEPDQAIWVKLRPEMLIDTPVWDGAPADVTLSWKSGSRSKVIEQYAAQEVKSFLRTMFGDGVAETVRLGEITTPIHVRDTLLSTATAGKNMVMFGDCFRTGTFQSGSGFNLLLTMDCNALKTLIGSKESREAAFEEYTSSVRKSALRWHERNVAAFHSEGVPPFVSHAERAEGVLKYKNYPEFVAKLVQPTMMKIRKEQPRL
ncbi:hypothetical protein SmJEL517_g06082 [Synchytrium microbalum]|uniref:FAD-binding domain-containing protein n=1 Tax=Synchytrium microbalum TaxID=1806994 RepID=A0A507BX05_9FUNG|nr:uncharacterized protein SmJEL517_g06082 [Synchytrium microbalum]TPX30334.1 hypothetical protein SmJEL517_g06082 [Synchytrium microbalum]